MMPVKTSVGQKLDRVMRSAKQPNKGERLAQELSKVERSAQEPSKGERLAQEQSKVTRSSSPLSGWTRVYEDSNQCLQAEITPRSQFTIMPDENIGFSPRLPNPELTQLECEGMVSLSTPRPAAHTDEDIEDAEKANQIFVEIKEKKTKSVTFSSTIGGEEEDIPFKNDVTTECDDGLVIVTDKATQTNQSMPLEHSVNDVTCNDLSRGSYDNTKTEVDYNGDVESNGDDNPQQSNTSSLRENQKNTHNDFTSEAPTLKVEYVGKVWDAYINDFLLASDDITEAAIYDKYTKRCIACSSHYVMSDDEYNQLVTCLGSLSMAYRCQLKINDRPFKTMLADGRRGLMAKGEERDGFSACQTRTLVLVAIHDRCGKGQRCNEELMRLGDFFWAKGL